VRIDPATTNENFELASKPLSYPQNPQILKILACLICLGFQNHQKLKTQSPKPRKPNFSRKPQKTLKLYKPLVSLWGRSVLEFQVRFSIERWRMNLSHLSAEFHLKFLCDLKVFNNILK